MKFNITYQFLLTLILVFSTSLLVKAQSDEEIKVPLSKPNEAGHLKVSIHDGSLIVEGYSGKEVIVIMQTPEDKKKPEKMKNGLTRIPNTSRDFSITERNNVVGIQAGSKSSSNFIVKVPRNFSISAKTHHNGAIKVKDIEGELELAGHHEGIQALNVTGSVVASTHHGDIIITFSAINKETPMAFSTYHGDIDVSFPANLKASSKIKSERGEIFTDFEFATNNSNNSKVVENKGGTKMIISNWVYADIGGGGPEFMFTTHHGDVIIRKAE